MRVPDSDDWIRRTCKQQAASAPAKAREREKSRIRGGKSHKRDICCVGVDSFLLPGNSSPGLDAADDSAADEQCG